MLISWTKEEGFKLDIPYSKWLIFCVGLAIVVNAIRWW